MFTDFFEFKMIGKTSHRQKINLSILPFVSACTSRNHQDFLVAEVGTKFLLLFVPITFEKSDGIFGLGVNFFQINFDFLTIPLWRNSCGI